MIRTRRARAIALTVAGLVMFDAVFALLSYQQGIRWGSTDHYGWTAVALVSGVLVPAFITGAALLLGAVFVACEWIDRGEK